MLAAARLGKIKNKISMSYFSKGKWINGKWVDTILKPEKPPLPPFIIHDITNKKSEGIQKCQQQQD